MQVRIRRNLIQIYSNISTTNTFDSVKVLFFWFFVSESIRKERKERQEKSFFLFNILIFMIYRKFRFLSSTVGVKDARWPTQTFQAYSINLIRLFMYNILYVILK